MEVIRDMSDLRDALKTRVTIEWPQDVRQPRAWWDIAQELQNESQALAIVSKRHDCTELHSVMPEGTYALSTLMCAEHRSQVIAEIKRKLQENERVHLISTQVVECGVDFSFPLVMRALPGLDSVAQAAGRCNREGRMQGAGRVVVFVPPTDPPRGILTKARDTTVDLMQREGWNPEDPFATETMAAYFEGMYGRVNSLDRKDILRDLRVEFHGRQPMINFRKADEKFQMIDSRARWPVIIPFGRGKGLATRLIEYGFDRGIMRRLQRYIVTVFEGELERLDLAVYGEDEEQVRILKDMGQYSEVTGLRIFE
jgi:CRISPR-associated endonuclease/helicase Cas3